MLTILNSHFAEIAVLLNVCWLDVRLEYRGILNITYYIFHIVLLLISQFVILCST